MKNITQLFKFPQHIIDVFDTAYSVVNLSNIEEFHSYKIIAYNDKKVFNPDSERLLRNLGIRYIMFFSVSIPYKTHIDRESPVALNIPASGCNRGITYAAKPECLDKVLKSKTTRNLSQGPIDEFVFDPKDYDFFDQSVPYLLNTHVPHGGYSKYNSETREFWSIRFDQKYTYHDLVDKFEKWQ